MSTVIGPLEAHKEQFAQCVLPAVERHARIVFRHLRRRGDDFAEAIADCVAHAWMGFVSALRAGKEPRSFVSAIARFAARKTKVGLKIGKPDRVQDVFNGARSDRVRLTHLADAEYWQEAVRDNTETPPPEQAAFRLDFPAWLRTLTARDRKIARTLVAWHSAKEVARRLKLTEGRVSQIRSQLRDEWELFTA